MRVLKEFVQGMMVVFDPEFLGLVFAAIALSGFIMLMAYAVFG